MEVHFESVVHVALLRSACNIRGAMPKGGSRQNKEKTKKTLDKYGKTKKIKENNTNSGIRTTTRKNKQKTSFAHCFRQFMALPVGFGIRLSQMLRRKPEHIPKTGWSIWPFYAKKINSC